MLTIPINEAKMAFNRMHDSTALKKESKGCIKLTEFKSLKLQNMSFRSPGRKHILKNINISINKNECIAIVGESGSGKSTLGQILQKFYTPESGDIILNNKVQLGKVSTKDWRNLLGVVSQEIDVFNGTVLDNISLRNKYNPENIISLCKAYGLNQFIEIFPQGYATILGESGINLSGGQKQLIALAIALYKKPEY